MRGILPATLALFILTQSALSSLPPCQDISYDTSSYIYDFIVVGGGPGGGPVAARLAESGYSGILHCLN